MALATLKVTIVGWDKFNGRKDVKKPSWFRVEYRLLEDPDFYDFTHEEFKAWLYILAQACRKNAGTVVLNFAHAKATSRLSEAGIRSAVEKLVGLQLVHADVTHPSRERHEDDTRQDRTVQDRTVQDETEQNRTGPLKSDDYERVYEKFPRKLGKQQGIAKAKRDCKTSQELEALSQAVDRFVAYHREKGTEAQYIPYFSTFMSSWRDWVDPETGKADALALKSRSIADILADEEKAS